MITIIIASANKRFLADIRENIKDTIGVDFEIIGFENANAEKGICELYNMGIAQARYDILCFIHEDIKILTEDWGRIIIDIFNGNKKLGLLGLAGSQYKAMSPSSWFTWLPQYNRCHMIQRFKFNKEEAREVYHNPHNEKLAKVSGIDGVWLCTHKKVTNEIKFDEDLLKGFHGYDVDFSLSVGERWDINVTYDVFIEHFSEGNFDKKWIESTLLIHKKWKRILPKGREYLTSQDAMECEERAFIFFIDRMWSAGYAKMKIWNVLWASKIYTKYGWKLFFKLFKYIRRKS